MIILIAEDDRVTRRKLARFLGKMGHEVIEAGDGREALEAFSRGPIPIVITDWDMPNMDGLELVREIRKESGREYVYIIMLTHKDAKADLIASMDAGVDDFAVKPIELDELRVRLRAGQRIIELEQNLSRRNAQLQKANAEMKASLNAAAEIQAALLPASAPDLDGMRVTWRFRPCDELAGDVFNVFELRPGLLAFYVLDVCGHGVPAALLSVTLSRLLTPIPDQGSLLLTPAENERGYAITPPVQVVDTLNKRFQIEKNGEQYFTMVYGTIDLVTRTLNYVSAGHPGAVHLPRGAAARLLDVRSLPVGFVEEAGYRENKLQLGHGDRLFLYSDGVTEAASPEQDLFGVDRFISAVSETRDLPLDGSLDELITRTEAWCGSSSFKDDLTILALEIKG